MLGSDAIRGGPHEERSPKRARASRASTQVLVPALLPTPPGLPAKHHPALLPNTTRPCCQHHRPCCQTPPGLAAKHHPALLPNTTRPVAKHHPALPADTHIAFPYQHTPSLFLSIHTTLPLPTHTPQPAPTGGAAQMHPRCIPIWQATPLELGPVASLLEAPLVSDSDPAEVAAMLEAPPPDSDPAEVGCHVRKRRSPRLRPGRGGCHVKAPLAPTPTRQWYIPDSCSFSTVIPTVILRDHYMMLYGSLHDRFMTGGVSAL